MASLFEQPQATSQLAAESADLDQALVNFVPKPAVVVEARSPLMPSIGDAVSEETTESTEETKEEETDASANGGEPAAEEQVEPTAFALQFKEAFGIEPTEAVELVNGLQGFRDEMSLMRTWGVTPGEYDNRITQVREMYNSLPEEGREQFNSVEGAAAIWDFISKQNSGQTTVSKAAKPQASKTTTKQQPKAQVYKRSYFDSMSKEDYKRNLPLMQKAFLEGRIIEDRG